MLMNFLLRKTCPTDYSPKLLLMNTELKERHILITGASRGLGRSLAARLAPTGAKLSLLARNFNELEALRNSLDGRIAVYGADITDRQALGDALSYFRDQHGRFDILINNAGTGAYKPLAESSVDEVEVTLAVNLESVALLTHRLLPDLRESDNARILNISSDLGRRPLANMAVYTASKHGMAGLSQSLTRELAKDDIRVMMLNPGIIDTYFGGKDQGDTPPPYGIDPDDLADIAVFMLTRPGYLLMDEVTVHPMKQDF